MFYQNLLLRKKNFFKSLSVYFNKPYTFQKAIRALKPKLGNSRFRFRMKHIEKRFAYFKFLRYLRIKFHFINSH